MGACLPAAGLKLRGYSEFNLQAGTRCYRLKLIAPF